DRPFSARWEFLSLGDVVATQFEGSINRATRTARHVASETDDAGFRLSFNLGPSPWSMVQRGRELPSSAIAPAFVSYTEAVDFHAAGEHARRGLSLPRGPLLDLVADADDRVLTPLDPNSEAL